MTLLCTVTHYEWLCLEIVLTCYSQMTNVPPPAISQTVSVQDSLGGQGQLFTTAVDHLRYRATVQCSATVQYSAAVQ